MNSSHTQNEWPLQKSNWMKQARYKHIPTEWTPFIWLFQISKTKLKYLESEMWLPFRGREKINIGKGQNRDFWGITNSLFDLGGGYIHTCFVIYVLLTFLSWYCASVSKSLRKKGKEREKTVKHWGLIHYRCERSSPFSKQATIS